MHDIPGSVVLLERYNGQIEPTPHATLIHSRSHICAQAHVHGIPRAAHERRNIGVDPSQDVALSLQVAHLMEHWMRVRFERRSSRMEPSPHATLTRSHSRMRTLAHVLRIPRSVGPCERHNSRMKPAQCATLTRSHSHIRAQARVHGIPRGAVPCERRNRWVEHPILGVLGLG